MSRLIKINLQCIVYFIGVFIVASVARAQTVPLAEVPESITDAGEKAVLRARHGRLENYLKSLQRTGDIFNSDCAKVEVDTPAYYECEKRYSEIQGFIEAFNNEARAFNSAVEESVRRSSSVIPGSAKKTAGDKRRPLLTGDTLEAAKLDAMSRAAFRIGGDLALAGYYEKSVPYLREAVALNPGCRMCRRELVKAERMAADFSAQEEEILIRMILQEMELPGVSIKDIDPRTKNDYILDALEYGNGSWEGTLRYMRDLSYARPENKNIRAALTELEGLAADLDTLKDEH